MIKIFLPLFRFNLVRFETPPSEKLNYFLNHYKVAQLQYGKLSIIKN